MKPGTKIGVVQTQRLQLSASLQASLRVLRADAAGLARYLEEQAAEIPALSLQVAQPPAGEWLPRWTGVLQRHSTSPQETAASHGPSLYAHVAERVPHLLATPAQGRIALALIEALEPTGWLGRDVAVIAGELAVPAAEVEAVLKRLQRVEPRGLFARNLAECLRLQAEEAKVLDGLMELMLARLDLVGSGDWAQLALLAGVDEAEVLRRFRTIRSFNPKPGTAFSAVASPLREPDLMVRQGGEGWEVSLNRSSLPAIHIVEGAKGGAKARAVVRLIEGRNATLLSVAQTVLTHQRAALDAGPGALRPLTMQTVAEALTLHKSTVSRVVAGTAVDTPHGTWWLRALFSPDMGADTGAAALRARLARLVAGEDAALPLTDEALAAALSEGDTVVARRTVAKYRAALRIAPAHRRRVRAKG